VSITATNQLAIGTGIDLSAATQNLAVYAPVFMGVDQAGGGGQFWTVTNNRTLTVSGPVSGFVPLTISGGGSVYLSGTNDYVGNTTISSGSLTVSGAGQLGAGSYAATITDNGVFNYASSASQTISGTVLGSGSLTVSGPGWLQLSGTNTYAGPTIVTGGTLALSGNGSVASTNLIVAGGAELDFSGLSAAFTLGSMRTLSNSSVGAILGGNGNCSAGMLSLLSDAVNPSLIQANGTLTLSASTVFKVNNTGPILGVGRHPVIGTMLGGRVGGTLPSVAVTGAGTAGTTTLQTNSSGGLDLVVTSTASTNSTSLKISPGSGSFTLTWPGDHLGWVAQSNSVDLANPGAWSDIPGSQLATNLILNVTPGSPKVFYRLRYPN
jgi:autotransporter-associated beta strand protein